MPGAYPIPPWLQPTDAIGAMTRGAELGQRAASLSQNYALASQRLDQEQSNFEREAQVKEETMRMQQEREAQQMAMEDAYNQARIGLQRSDIDMKAQQMARDFAISKKYQDSYNSLVQGGMDPSDAATQSAQMIGPELFQGNAAGFAGLMRQAQMNKPVPPPTLQQYATGPGGAMQPWLIDAEGKPHEARVPAMDPIQRFQITQGIRQSEKILDNFNQKWGDPLLSKTLKKSDPEAYDAAVSQRDEALDFLKQNDPNNPYVRGKGQSSTGGAAAPTDANIQITFRRTDGKGAAPAAPSGGLMNMILPQELSDEDETAGPQLPNVGNLLRKLTVPTPE